eukprot:39962-Rhodomonas_salina.1
MPERMLCFSLSPWALFLGIMFCAQILSSHVAAERTAFLMSPQLLSPLSGLRAGPRGTSKPMPAATPSRARCTSFQSLRANAVDDLEKLVANAVAEDEKRGSSILDAMTEVSTENVADRPWSAVFNPLAQDPVFRRDFWARKPFKLSTKMPFAVNCFTFKDLEKYAHMYPSHWAGTGTLVASGGWMMASIRRDACKYPRNV